MFSRYAKVVEADGSAMPVSDALAIINDVLGEVLDGEEAELDADTRFATTWYAPARLQPGPGSAMPTVRRGPRTPRWTGSSRQVSARHEAVHSGCTSDQSWTRSGTR